MGDVEELVEERVEVRFDSSSFEFIAFESERGGGRGTGRLSGETPSETQDRPVSFGDVPSERSVGRHFVGDIED